MSARIYGVMKDAATNQVISTATASAPGYTVTNTSGSYTLTTPGAATVTLTASATGYTPQTQDVTVINTQQKNVNFLLVHV